MALVDKQQSELIGNISAPANKRRTITAVDKAAAEKPGKKDLTVHKSQNEDETETVPGQHPVPPVSMRIARSAITGGYFWLSCVQSGLQYACNKVIGTKKVGSGSSSSDSKGGSKPDPNDTDDTMYDVASIVGRMRKNPGAHEIDSAASPTKIEAHADAGHFFLTHEEELQLESQNSQGNGVPQQKPKVENSQGGDLPKDAG